MFVYCIKLVHVLKYVPLHFAFSSWMDEVGLGGQVLRFLWSGERDESKVVCIYTDQTKRM